MDIGSMKCLGLYNSVSYYGCSLDILKSGVQKIFKKKGKRENDVVFS